MIFNFWRIFCVLLLVVAVIAVPKIGVRPLRRTGTNDF
jgi:hypothetical protein